MGSDRLKLIIALHNAVINSISLICKGYNGEAKQVHATDSAKYIKEDVAWTTCKLNKNIFAFNFTVFHRRSSNKLIFTLGHNIFIFNFI
jgi:hypothetical protein